MKCEKCGATITNESDAYSYGGQTLCEDCYLDIVAAPKTCDPWAVHSAKNLSQDKPLLTPLQEKIMSIIKERGPVTAEDICQTLGITESEFRTNFAPLRHMELARACKVGNKVCYTLFDR
ncbi:MAG TPA: hypothetical protein ENG14_02065 [Thermodesulforhabdus norvegica]|uniref:Winged helix-turn-helix DNA-binding n=1 Tax=Thermodesulforhabdus norvegica TaxID=39841 RepID=A0A7C0WUF2_9BACT|nr:hypothetical protein [Deltaproteobacteria bacterium]MBW2068519.1 hypothetical protein [Deltaproteobacteria bacterium]HDL89670.1 hypothetical protein [Thermodesulforhabdus norvegica]